MDSFDFNCRTALFNVFKEKQIQQVKVDLILFLLDNEWETL